MISSEYRWDFVHQNLTTIFAKDDSMCITPFDQTAIFNVNVVFKYSNKKKTLVVTITDDFVRNQYQNAGKQNVILNKIL